MTKVKRNSHEIQSEWTQLLHREQVSWQLSAYDSPDAVLSPPAGEK